MKIYNNSEHEETDMQLVYDMGVAVLHHISHTCVNEMCDKILHMQLWNFDCFEYSMNEFQVMSFI